MTHLYPTDFAPPIQSAPGTQRCNTCGSPLEADHAPTCDAPLTTCARPGCKAVILRVGQVPRGPLTACGRCHRVQFVPRSFRRTPCPAV